MANPILNENNFNERERVLEGAPMTINGTIQVTVFLFLLLVLAATFTWSRFSVDNGLTMQLTWGGLLVAFVLGLIISFTRNKYLVPFYAVCEGLALGGISAMFEAQFQGIVVQAVAGTFAALFSMLLLYKTGVIKCTDKFRSVIFITTASIAGVYLVNWIGGFFNMQVPLVNSDSHAGIIVSLFVTAIASLNLIIDFDFIERGAQYMLPKDYEWFGAFGLMVTIVWVYLEILRLLAKLSRK